MYSEIALKILAAKECGMIKSNAHFWSNFGDKNKFEKEVMNNEIILETMNNISDELDSAEDKIKVTCIFDDDFPIINKTVKNNSEKPYLLFYKGDISLLKNLNMNVAVIGLTNPEKEIIEREEIIVGNLVKNDLTIVSGLALGCDTVAHETCLKTKGKTIAILPSQINKVVPAQNKELATSIVNEGGLLVSEYYRDPNSRYEAIGRFIERDRLQAMFAKAIILIASYRKGEGDSGSRHAMEAARKYDIESYVMYNKDTDKGNTQFGLNKDLLEMTTQNQVKILFGNSIEEIKNFQNPNLRLRNNTTPDNQLTML